MVIKMQISNKFMNWYHGNNETKKVPPKSGAARVVYIIMNYSGKLIVINFVFILCCIPMITIPAALAALNHYLIKIFRQGYGFSPSDFFGEFRNDLLKGIPLGLLTVTLGGYAYYLLSLAGNYKENNLGAITNGIGFGVLFISILMGTYFFVLMSMLDLSNKNIIKNTLILMVMEWKKSALLCAFIFTLWVAVLLLFPYSVLIMLIAGFSIQQLVVCAVVLPIVNARIVEPYENRKCNC